MNDAETRKSEPCAPCHGEGKVISKLGGQTKHVTCPWCQGGGVRLVGADAQAWRVEQDSGGGSRRARAT